MTLEIKKIELAQFQKRWMDKANHYNSEELSDCFDKFFTLFVIYNRIYNVIVPLLKENGQLQTLIDQGKIKLTKKKKEPNDSESAVFCVTHFIRDHLEEIISNKNEITEFKNIITNHLFYIDLHFGQHQPNEDLKLLRGLNSSDNVKVIESLLRILYNLRCNLFHGEKGYTMDQKIVLIPAINVLIRLIELMMRILNPN